MTPAAEPQGAQRTITVPLNRLQPALYAPDAAGYDPETIAHKVTAVLSSGSYARLVVAAEEDPNERQTIRWRVVEGEDLRLALRLLAFRGQIKKSHPIDCVIFENDALHRDAADVAQARAPATTATERTQSSAALQAAVPQDPETAVVAVAHAFVIARFYPDEYDLSDDASGPLSRGDVPAELTSSAPRGHRLAERHAAWLRRLPRTSSGL